MTTKTPWLRGIKNGTGQDAPTWRGDTRATMRLSLIAVVSSPNLR